MIKKINFKIILLFVLTISCTQDQSYKEKIKDPELVQANVKNLTDIIVYDIFSPPVASRVYAYPSIAAYETMRFSKPKKFITLSGQVKELEQVKSPEDKNINFNLAALYAFNKVGRALIFSEDKMDSFDEIFYKKIKSFKTPRRVIKSSKKYGEFVADHVLEWAKYDNYNQTRTYPKYTIREPENFWKPTPPDYMDGIEPHWNKIRTLVIKSAGMFPSKPPIKFDLTKGSPFQNQLQQVYEIGENLSDEQIEIAKFWDCNPYVTHHRGHAMFATKKITPGGHWIGITSIVTRKAKSDFQATTNAYAYLLLFLMLS